MMSFTKDQVEYFEVIQKEKDYKEQERYSHPMLINLEDDNIEIEKKFVKTSGQASQIKPEEKETEVESLKFKIAELQDTNQFLQQQFSKCTKELDLCKEEIIQHKTLLLKFDNYFKNIIPAISKLEKVNDISIKQKNEKKEDQKLEDIEIKIGRLFDVQEKQLNQLKKFNDLEQETVYKTDLEQHKREIKSESENIFRDILKQMSEKFRELHTKLVDHANDILKDFEQQTTTQKNEWKKYKSEVDSEVCVYKTLISDTMKKVEVVEHERGYRQSSDRAYKHSSYRKEYYD